MRYQFEERFNVHIYCYDDLELLQGAVRSIPEDIKIYALDGRYVDFKGETDLTPGAEEWCKSRENVIYHSPPKSHLPFGKYGSSEHRYSQHEKGCWANYKILPPNQWTLQMDTDERLIRLNRDVFERFEDDHRYRPKILTDDGRRVTQPRIWKPKFWTLWIDDAAIPRDLASREYPLQYLQGQWKKYRSKRMEHVSEDDIFIENYGMARPDEYNERRANQLEAIRRGHRATKLRRQMKDFNFPEISEWE